MVKSQYPSVKSSLGAQTQEQFAATVWASLNNIYSTYLAIQFNILGVTVSYIINVKKKSKKVLSLTFIPRLQTSFEFASHSREDVA